MNVYDIDGNQIKGVSSYFESEMNDTIGKVRNLNDEPSIVFPVVTDIHRYSDVTQTFGELVKNLKYFVGEVKCDFLANMGDLIDGNVAKDTSLGYALSTSKELMNVGVPYLFAEGNHDNNIYSGSSSDYFDIKQVFKSFFTATKGVTYNFNERGTDYYIDFEGIGVRVIVLNACNIKKATNYAYGDSTASWLTNSALNTNHTVLLIEHLSSIASQVWNNNHGTNADAVTSALNSFKNGGGTIVQISGHSHLDIAFIAPWLSVMMVCQKFIVAPTGTEGTNKITGYIDELGHPNRVAETATEDAWTVCMLKPNSKEFDCIRFGAGVDRYFHYEPIAPTTLTTRLSNVTWSSSDTSVATVSNGVVTGVASGTCAILAKDAEGNYEAWTVTVA